jgi:DNA-directed RNA polymerase specialized sigma24 family protein
VRDDDGFAAFAGANARRLRHAARLLTGDDARAEDLLQTALVRAYLAVGPDPRRSPRS